MDETTFNIAELTERITIQRKTIAENSYGEPIETWVDLATVWAAKRPVRGYKRYLAQQNVAETDTEWIIRYRTDINPCDRLINRERIYDINGVLEIGRRALLEVYTKARAE